MKTTQELYLELRTLSEAAFDVHKKHGHSPEYRVLHRKYAEFRDSIDPTYREKIMNFKEFHVTGELRNGRRFKRMSFGSFEAASMINIYNGSVWGILENGRRKLIKRVYN